MCEEKQNMELTKLGGSFWEGGVEAVEKGVKEMSAADEEREEQDWVKEVTETLESLKGIVVSEGCERVWVLSFTTIDANHVQGHLPTMHSISRNCISSLTGHHSYWKPLPVACVMDLIDKIPSSECRWD